MNTPPTSQPMSGSWRRRWSLRARLYENLVTGTINKEEYTDYKAKYTRVAENAKEAIRALKDKLSDVLENRSERNRWIFPFHAVFHDGDPGPQSCGST